MTDIGSLPAKRLQLTATIERLTHLNGTLAVENARLRSIADSVPKLESRVVTLTKQLTEYMAEAKYLAAQLAKDDGDGARPLSAHESAVSVHDFLRNSAYLPADLDVPLGVTPHRYRTGLYRAVQKARDE